VLVTVTSRSLETIELIDGRACWLHSATVDASCTVVDLSYKVFLNVCSIGQDFNWNRSSRGPSAISELVLACSTLPICCADSHQLRIWYEQTIGERCITDSGISTYGLTDLRKGDEHKHSACLHLGWKTLFGLNSLVRCHSFSSFLTLLFYVVFVYCCFYVLRCVYQININNINDNANLVWLKSMKVYIIFFRPDSNITHVKDPCQMSITLTVTTITVCLNGWMKLIRHDIFEC